tara:strand:+ start:140 stop:442 length:303 start_codon:yes stop_codon:yes gene_type:complete
LVTGGIVEGHCAVVISPWFCCQQGDMIDTDNCLINVAPALAVELEGSGLGGLEGVARLVCGYLFWYRCWAGPRPRGSGALTQRPLRLADFFWTETPLTML